MMAEKLRRNKRRKVLFYSIAVILLFFGILSYTNLQDSLFLHSASKERRDHALTGQKYVEGRLKDIQEYSLKGAYDTQDIGFLEQEKVNRIDLRGVQNGSDEGKVFSEDEATFNVIEQ